MKRMLYLVVAVVPLFLSSFAAGQANVPPNKSVRVEITFDDPEPPYYFVTMGGKVTLYSLSSGRHEQSTTLNTSNWARYPRVLEFHNLRPGLYRATAEFRAGNGYRDYTPEYPGVVCHKYFFLGDETPTIQFDYVYLGPITCTTR